MSVRFFHGCAHRLETAGELGSMTAIPVRTLVFTALLKWLWECRTLLFSNIYTHLEPSRAVDAVYFFLLLLCWGLYFQTGMATKSYCFPIPVLQNNTHVCKHIQYAVCTVVLQDYHSLPLRLSWPPHTLKHHCSSQWAKDILACQDCSFAVSCEQRQALKQHSPRMESTPFLRRTLASTNSFQEFFGVGRGRDGLQNLHLRTFFSNIWKYLCFLHLALAVSKENTLLLNFKIKRESLLVNKFLKQLKCQTTKVQKNDINFEYARQQENTICFPDNSSSE